MLTKKQAFKNIINGSSRADLIDGTDARDFVRGHAGNDTISGGEGSDLLEGWEGDDTIIGGHGADEVRGDGGHDTLAFSSDGGNDLVRSFVMAGTRDGAKSSDKLVLTDMSVSDLYIVERSDAVSWWNDTYDGTARVEDRGPSIVLLKVGQTMENHDWSIVLVGIHGVTVAELFA